MRILPEPIAFEWDDGNVDKNAQKHDVTIQEAEEVFANEPFVTSEDAKHSTAREKRFHALGQSRTHRKLFVVFTVRNRKVRVISIRDMHRKERQIYEQFEEDPRL